MRYHYRSLLLALLMGASGNALATALDLLPPTSMQIDPGSTVIARGLDFVDAPLSGAVNFSPYNYDVHLPGGMVIPVQDVVPYFSIQQPINDCQGVATVLVETAMVPFNTLTQYIFPEVFGTNQIPQNILDPNTLFNGFLVQCNNDPKLIDQLMSGGSLPRQIVADVRNTSVGATDVIFSGQLLDPYTDFPMASPGYAGTIIGGGSTVSNDVWSDGIVMAGYKSAFPDFLGTPLMSSSLLFYRFQPGAGQKKVLQFAGLSTAWLDKPIQINGVVNNPCFKDNPIKDPNNPIIIKTDAELLASGCVGESSPVGIVAPNFYGHSNDKLKDLVVLSRAPMGDPKNPESKIGYLTLYRRTNVVPNGAIPFQHFWQFDKSVTAATGIQEPYGIAVVKNWDAKAKLFTEGVVAGSNRLFGDMKFGNAYYVYYYTNGMQDPKPIKVGEAFNPEYPGLGGFGPYRIYSADVDNDGCGDIFITRAQIAPDGKAITFADYFDVHLQKTGPAGCLGDFDPKGSIYKIQPIAAKLSPQISSLAIADLDKDGLKDVVAGDFTSYPNAATKINESVVHYLRFEKGLFNTVSPPHYVVNTKTHGADVGVIDVKTDSFANVGVVIGNAMAFEEIKIPLASLTCGSGGKVYDASWLDPALNNDTDKDGIPDCHVYLSGGNPTTGNCKMICDNCSQFHAPDVATINACKADISKCANPDQIDSDSDNYGDICDAFPNDNQQSRLAPKMLPVAKAKTRIREDKVVYADAQPVIANYNELKVVDAKLPADKGHEVTVLLNKTNVTGTPPACQGTAEECFCEKNPNLPYCMCKKDPSLPECRTLLLQEMTCCLDVCRGDLTAPFPAMCDYIRPYNDEIRKITGLCMDVLVPVEGTQYHLSCTMPNAPALNLGAGKAYAQIFKASGGQVPRNYFKDWQKPVASQNLLKNNVLLNPLDDAITGGAQLNVGALPKPNFSYDASLSAVAPEATVNQAPGITQIDGIMQIETYLADIDPATGAPVTKQVVNPIGGAAPAVSKALLLDIKGFSSPPGCQWSGQDCPDPMPNPPPPQYFVNAVQAKVLEYEAAGKPITIETINEAFNAMDVGPAFMHQKFVVSGSQNAMVVHMQNIMGGFGAEGGCGCTFSALPTPHNTVLPLLMAVAALGGMFVLRRNTAKKH